MTKITANLLADGVTPSGDLYGFVVESDGTLKVISTNKGADNIDQATSESFKDVVFSNSELTWSINNTDLIVTT